jgi:hypothetical protein
MQKPGDYKGLIADARRAVAGASGTVVPMVDGGPYTVATLPAAGAGNFGQLVQVSDLWDGATIDFLVSSGEFGVSHYWRPLNPVHVNSFAAQLGGTMVPLSDAQIQRMTGTMFEDTALDIDDTNAWRGAIFELVEAAGFSNGGFSVTITGVSGSPANYTGGYRRFVYTGSVWEEL